MPYVQKIGTAIGEARLSKVVEFIIYHHRFLLSQNALDLEDDPPNPLEEWDQEEDDN
ncbi:hypothetical protein IQ268_28305 [Oculatella sp. LEGE 06141]|uniref:hypothetical protein n=1 Tax=Oculatella sp. LEGE 06141 TaxID=1828648 RepID=UPI00187EE039|nr:hypothetical protein [Oculatella sp. LEGE 06141]MBE9182456.1 hypothetical protein [Oculatella sp. LEGE 06141]